MIKLKYAAVVMTGVIIFAGGYYALHSTHLPKQPGQAAFGALSEVAALLDNDNTDWASVDMDALLAHLKDMDALLMDTTVTKRELPNGLTMNVTGESAAAQHSMQQMIPTHSDFLATVRPEWKITYRKITGGYALRVTSDVPQQAAKIKALGFSGFMVQDDHHAAHHLQIASGKQGSHAHAH